jgi:hypothetical protein
MCSIRISSTNCYKTAKLETVTHFTDGLRKFKNEKKKTTVLYDMPYETHLLWIIYELLGTCFTLTIILSGSINNFNLLSSGI